MKTFLLIAIVTTLTLGAVSCTCLQSQQEVFSVQVGVETQKGAIFEVYLDNALVGSSKTISNRITAVSFSAPIGEHELKVKAKGYIPWERKISITGATKKGQAFFAKLQLLKK